MKAPCKDCVDRTLGCHGSCEHYLKYKEENKKIKEARSKEYQRFIGVKENAERMKKSRCTNDVVKCDRYR